MPADVSLSALIVAPDRNIKRAEDKVLVRRIAMLTGIR